MGVEPEWADAILIALAVNRQQHLVSQFTSRQFLGGRDRLFCLDKKTLRVADRVHGNVPADILKGPYYYTNEIEDFDKDIVQPLENALGPVIRKFVADPETPAPLEEQRLLVDWCALALTRNLYFAHVTPYAYGALSPEEKSGLPTDLKAITLVGRRAVYQRLRKELRQRELMLQFVKSPHDFGYYLTDSPTVPIPFRKVGSIGPLLLPLSHRLMALLVPAELFEEFHRTTKPELGWLTLMQCGWAQRLIYSADLDALDFAAWVLMDGPSAYPRALRDRARQPFFGFGEPTELAALYSAPVAPFS